MSPVCESVVGSEPHGSKVYGNNLPGVSGPQRLFFFCVKVVNLQKSSRQD